MPYVQFLFICCVWGGSFILMDRALLAFSPIDIALGRLIGGATVLGLFCLATRQWARLGPVDWAHLFLVAFLSNTIPFVIQPYVMDQAGEHAYFGMMVAFVPLATILASIPMLRKWPSAKQLLGVLGGLVCMLFVVQDGSQRGISLSLLALALTVPLVYALGNTYIKWKLDHLPAAPLTAIFLGVGGLLLIPMQFAPALVEQMGLSGPAAPTDWPLAIASLLFLSVVGTGIAVLMFIRLIQTQGPLFAGMVTYVVPLLALVWGQYDSELLTSTQVLAMIGVLAMVAVVQWGAATPNQTALSIRPPAGPQRGPRSPDTNLPPTNSELAEPNNVATSSPPQAEPATD